MITGLVKADEGRVRVTVNGSQERSHQVDAIVDTGYTASLTLPPALVAELRLRWQCTDRGTLADGSECLIDVFEAEVEWDGEVHRILVDETDSEPLVGMQLMRGYELTMQIQERGKVTIQRMA